MAKGKKTVAPVADVVPVVPICGGCAHAYGYCWPGREGKPLMCRCEHHPGRLMLVSSRACCRRAEGGAVPERTDLRLSEERHPEPDEKVVPLFRVGERRPWKTVRVADIPAGYSVSSETGEFVK